MRLHDLSPANGSKKNRKRLGRGVASGQGKTAGKGSKGQNARSGGGVRPGYEGGQMPIHRRLPKRGFTNIHKKQIDIINIVDLNMFENGAIVDKSALIQFGIIKTAKRDVKLLSNGEIEVALTVKINHASKQAIQKIESAGGRVEVLQ